MRAVGYREAGGPEVLTDVTIEEPTPGPGDLLVEVRAVSVNPVDTKIRVRQSPPAGDVRVLGWDAVGTVRAVGSQVTMFEPGDRVWYAGAVIRPGCDSELHVVDERLVARAPSSLDDGDAAALPLTTITAWELLFDRLHVPRGRSLYGTLPDQLADPRSFASQLAGILRVRNQFGLATGTQLDVPRVSHRAMLVMVHQLDIGKQITVLNFAAEPISGTVRSKHLPPGSVVVDMVTGIQVGEVDDLHSFAISLDSHEGLTLLVGEP